MNRTFVVGVLAALLLATGSPCWADSFGSDENSFSIDFVTIGSPGNPADTTGSPNPAGSVPYVYRIGKYEISEQMIDKANAVGALGITKDTRGPDKPATSVSWFDAAQFVNWLNTSTGNTPAYKFDGSGNFQLWTPSDLGYDANNLFRNSQAKYFLPSANEWYKAAYYDPSAGVYWDYPTGSNSPPTAVPNGTLPGTAVVLQGLNGPADVTQAGGLSAYGTMAQGGNIAEWQETALDLSNDDPLEFRSVRGGNWADVSSGLRSAFRGGAQPTREGGGGGLRIASIIPEPSTDAILVSMMCMLLYMKRRIAIAGEAITRFASSFE
jgi:hypothetical protein